MCQCIFSHTHIHTQSITDFEGPWCLHWPSSMWKPLSSSCVQANQRSLVRVKWPSHTPTLLPLMLNTRLPSVTAPHLCNARWEVLLNNGLPSKHSSPLSVRRTTACVLQRICGEDNDISASVFTSGNKSRLVIHVSKSVMSLRCERFTWKTVVTVIGWISQNLSGSSSGDNSPQNQ